MFRQISLIIFGLLISCGDDNPKAGSSFVINPAFEVGSLTILSNSDSIRIGDTLNITTTIMPRYDFKSFAFVELSNVESCKVIIPETEQEHFAGSISTVVARNLICHSQELLTIPWKVILEKAHYPLIIHFTFYLDSVYLADSFKYYLPDDSQLTNRNIFIGDSRPGGQIQIPLTN